MINGFLIRNEKVCDTSTFDTGSSTNLREKAWSFVWTSESSRLDFRGCLGYCVLNPLSVSGQERRVVTLFILASTIPEVEQTNTSPCGHDLEDLLLKILSHPYATDRVGLILTNVYPDIVRGGKGGGGSP